MAKYVVKVSRDKGGFRLIIPRNIVKEMGWDSVKYITVEHYPKDFVMIRRLLIEQEEKGHTAGN